MKIYLACTVRGDRGALAAARALAARLTGLGHEIVTAHLLADDVETGEALLTEREVFARDLAWLGDCDVLVAEASGSSFGVGFEVGFILGRAGASHQEVILVYDASRAAAISRLIVGATHARCATFAYENVDDLVSFVAARVGRADRSDD